MEDKGAFQRTGFREGAVAAAGVLALLLAVLGSLAAQGDAGFARMGQGMLVGALLLGLVAAILALPLEAFRRMRANVSGGAGYDRLQTLSGLRIASILMGFLLILGGVLVALLTLVRMDLLSVHVGETARDRALAVLDGILLCAILAAFFQSLRSPPLRPLTAGDRFLAYTTLALGAFGFALAFLTVTLEGAFADPAPLVANGDGPGLVLFGALMLGIAVQRARRLPRLLGLLTEDHGPSGGKGDIRRAKAVLLPAVMAFTLLMVVFLLLILVSVDLGGFLTNVGGNPVVLVGLLFVVLAIGASVAIAFFLSKSAELEQPLYKRLPDPRRRIRQAQVAVSLVVAALLLMAAYMAYHDIGFAKGTWEHFLFLGLLCGLGPYGFIMNKEHKRIRQLEERFPDFLRDIASSHRGGLTLAESIVVAARGEYGTLTPEVRKMADQLTWNVSFRDAFEKFAERVRTPLVQRAVSLILQAERSGGSTSEVLLAAARDAREIKNLENERRLAMSLYTVVIYVTFLVFLGVAAVLNGQFAPKFAEANAAASGASNDIGGASASFLGDQVSVDQSNLFYLTASLVQALGDGILAGMMGTGRAVLGLRHSFYMTLVTYVTFAFLL